MFEDGIVKPRQHGFDSETSMYCFGGGGGGGGGGSNTDNAYSNQQTGQGSRTTQPGDNTRIDSRGNTVNFNTRPAEVQSTPNYTKTLPSGVVVEDYSRPFAGQVNLSNQAMPAPEPEARSYLMSDYLATKSTRPEPLSYERFLEDTRNIGSTLLGTPLGASPAQTITNAQQALQQAQQIQKASPEMQALSKGYDALANQRISAPLGSGTITFSGGQTPGISYSQPIGPGFGKGNPLAEGIMSLMNVGKRPF